MGKTGSKLTNLTDKQLIELTESGEQAPYFVLMEKYKESLMSHIQKIVPTLEDAQDISQKSFEKAFINISKYDSKYAFSTWLYNIATNVAIDHLRKHKALQSSIPIEEDVFVMNLAADETPERKVIVDQSLSEVFTAISALPRGYMQVAELRFLKGYAYEEIAAQLDIPIGTVKTRINRARALLSQVLEKPNDGTNN